ncbi:MAG: hypothetical protein QNJ81_05975 [Acidimicrobiia bacterium]|nr:hypothetical protein [Acidimicrobiia bacterium]
MTEQHQACEQRERPINVDSEYRNDRTFLGDGPEAQRFMVAIMVLVTIIWLANVVWFVDSASHGAGLPYETWWQHWLLIAFAAIPVYAAIGQLHRQTRSTQSRFLRVVVFLVPPIAAVHLIGIAGKCVSLNGLASYSCSPVGCGCPENASFLGWAGLYVGFAVLVVTTVYILLADRARLR